MKTPSQPRAIFYIVAIQIWEYFSFYGMRALLILYLTHQLGFNDSHAINLLLWPLLSAATACLNPILAVCWANFTPLMTTAATGDSRCFSRRAVLIAPRCGRLNSPFQPGVGWY